MTRSLAQFFSATALTFLSACSSGPDVADYDPARGPFDADGNYVEEWVDNPPTKAEIERRKSRRDKDEDRIAKWEARETGREVIPTPRPATETRQARVTPPKPKPKAKPQVQKPKPQPKPRLVKPKAEPPIRHVVKKGDTLYSLSRRYNTTVSKIQSANNLSGTTIRLGQTLVIPRR